jgi:S-adenosylhomocysteine hydrolase
MRRWPFSFAKAGDRQMTNAKMKNCHGSVGVLSHSPPWVSIDRRLASGGSKMRAGKTAIVTGSTSGIGLGIASALAGQGANIVLNGFGPADEIEKIVSDLSTMSA